MTTRSSTSPSARWRLPDGSAPSTLAWKLWAHFDVPGLHNTAGRCLLIRYLCQIILGHPTLKKAVCIRSRSGYGGCRLVVRRRASVTSWLRAQTICGHTKFRRLRCRLLIKRVDQNINSTKKGAFSQRIGPPSIAGACQEALRCEKSAIGYTPTWANQCQIGHLSAVQICCR